MSFPLQIGQRVGWAYGFFIVQRMIPHRNQKSQVLTALKLRISDFRVKFLKVSSYSDFDEVEKHCARGTLAPMRAVLRNARGEVG
jgi:hypothetical protein